EASTPLSAESLRTDGASGASDGGALGAAGAGAAAGAAAGLAAAGAAAGSAPAAPSFIWPSNAPTATVSPSLAMISPSTPADGAGTSIVTLSVSSSTNGSSTATASPAFLNQRPMVASVTDSPSVGTRISVMVCFLLRHGLLSRPSTPLINIQKVRRECPGLSGRRCFAPFARAGRRRFGSAQCVVEKRLELRQMPGHQT